MNKNLSLAIGVIVALVILVLPFSGVAQSKSEISWINPAEEAGEEYVNMKGIYDDLVKKDILASSDILGFLIRNPNQISFPKEEGKKYFFMGDLEVSRMESRRVFLARYITFSGGKWIQDHQVAYYFDGEKLNKGFFFSKQDFIVLKE